MTIPGAACQHAVTPNTPATLAQQYAHAVSLPPPPYFYYCTVATVATLNNDPQQCTKKGYSSTTIIQPPWTLQHTSCAVLIKHIQNISLPPSTPTTPVSTHRINTKPPSSLRTINFHPACVKVCFRRLLGRSNMAFLGSITAPNESADSQLSIDCLFVSTRPLLPLLTPTPTGHPEP
ncbi:uncharacterized protein YALI1_E09602g [Yarrowia lipolytica]|uniref:Uncharacterized protein n=1 Tax=Yarrowia lipolytica TaxID=4952 RepID=A0A1D8NHJ7_YARLL|nr:hypothetical protein YALI1_E09602g [Yarrowia lipolytica]